MKHFKGYFDKINTDCQIIASDLLNISNKIKSNPLPWNGQFSPQLVQVLLQTFAKTGNVIFDPFLGSGTTFLETAELSLEAYGTEINYAAISLSRIYQYANVEFPNRVIILNELENQLIEHGVLYNADLFSVGNISPVIVIERILETNIGLKKILVEAFIILIDLYKQDFSSKWIDSKWKKLKELVLSLPVTQKSILPLQEDARKTSIQSSTVDLVITSPPYINVFNYHQQYRSSAEYLNGSVLPVAQAEIGSNRKNRGNRLYTVVQYCLDMAQVFFELSRVCKKNARIIFVVGRESSVRKTAFYNGEIITEIACRALGMDFVLKQERVFTNRFGQNIYEDILHFKNNKTISENWLDVARQISLEVLKSVKNTCPAETIIDLEDAISKVETLQPSTIYIQSKKEVLV